MTKAQDGSRLFGRRLLAAVALAMLFAAPAFAQDAGVSGIPQGPGNVNGLNNSGRDPSGIGNASRMAPLPGPNLNPVPVPSSGAATSTRARSVPTRVVQPRYSHLSPKARKIAEKEAVKENDRLLKHGVTSICRGC
jgi:hypothetical protein